MNLASSQCVQRASNFDPVTLAKEEITVDPDGSGSFPALTRTLERNEDTLRRSEGWDLKDGGTTEHSNAYSYIPASGPADGRLQSVAGSSSTFSYGYRTNSYGLIATVTGPVHTVANTWLPDRDALDLKENKVGTLPISKYDYEVNELSQRKNVQTSGSAFDTAVDTTVWAYDNLGQVLSAAHPVTPNNLGYTYDRMGNRKLSSRNTTDPSTASGTDLATYRQNTGSSSPGGNELNQYGVLELYGATTTLANTYDPDGNQLQGRFPMTSDTSTATGNVRTWDGENRLITAIVDGGMPTIYMYDAFHRRVIRGTGPTDVTMTLYDGWNPIADYYHTTSIALESSYTWGKDLSGSLQGAGGVGGLLAVERHSPAANPGIYYPTYDGNGNVSEYLDTSGAIAAHYEYGPFGEELPVANPGGLEDLFKHRFSTKPLDEETGYYYYGYRYYDPLSGRWPSRDPIGENGGLNMFVFLNNSSVSFTDAFGLCCAEDIDMNSDQLQNLLYDGISGIVDKFKMQYHGYRDSDQTGPFEGTDKHGTPTSGYIVQFRTNTSQSHYNDEAKREGDCAFSQHFRIITRTRNGVTELPISRTGVTASPVFYGEYGGYYDDFANVFQGGILKDEKVTYPRGHPSFIDEPRGIYDKYNPDLEIRQTFTTCINSSDACGACQYSKCCVRWERHLKIEAGKVTLNSVTKGVRWCEEAGQQSKF